MKLLLLLSCLISAAPAQGPTLEESVDSLIESIEKLRSKAQAARRQAADAESPKMRSKCIAALDKIRIELANLAEGLEQITSSDKNERGTLKGQITAALDLRDPKDVQAKLESIEEQITTEDGDPHSLLGVVRYHVADTLRKRAEYQILKTKDDLRAEKMLRLALKAYRAVHQAPEVEDGDLGTSLHASTLLRTIQIEASLFEGYRKMLRKNPRVKAYRKKMDKHREAGIRDIAEVRARFRDAELPNGERIIDAMAVDVRRLTGKARAGGR